MPVFDSWNTVTRYTEQGKLYCRGGLMIDTMLTIRTFDSFLCFQWPLNCTTSFSKNALCEDWNPTPWTALLEVYRLVEQRCALLGISATIRNEAAWANLLKKRWLDKSRPRLWLHTHVLWSLQERHVASFRASHTSKFGSVWLTICGYCLLAGVNHRYMILCVVNTSSLQM